MFIVYASGLQPPVRGSVGAGPHKDIYAIQIITLVYYITSPCYAEVFVFQLFS